MTLAKKPQVTPVAKNPTTNAGDERDTGLIPGLGRSGGGGNCNLLQYSSPGKSHRLRSLMGYSPWSHKQSDKTQHTHKKKLNLLRVGFPWWSTGWDSTRRMKRQRVQSPDRGTVGPQALLSGQKIESKNNC